MRTVSFHRSQLGYRKKKKVGGGGEIGECIEKVIVLE